MGYKYIDECTGLEYGQLDCYSNAELDAAEAECHSLIDATTDDFVRGYANLTLKDILAEKRVRANRQAAFAPYAARIDASMHHYWHSIGLE